MRVSPNIEGALMMTAAMTAFTFNDMFFKLLSGSVPFYQVFFLRSLAACALLGGMVRYWGLWRRGVSGRDWGLILIRSVSEVAAAYCFLTALVHIPIADATAILQALPLTVALGAAVFLREPVGWRRMTAILVGLVGVMLIVRPGGDAFNIYSLYAVGAVITVTIRDLTVRRMSADIPSLMVALVSSLCVAVFSGVCSAFVDWQPMTPAETAMLGGAAVFILAAYVFSVMAMRVGDIGFVSPFRYSGLVVALIVGLLVFREWPDGLTLLGAAIVVATGLFTLWRERQVLGDEL